jgi:hypothetical protein
MMMMMMMMMMISSIIYWHFTPFVFDQLLPLYFYSSPCDDYLIVHVKIDGDGVFWYRGFCGVPSSAVSLCDQDLLPLYLYY